MSQRSRREFMAEIGRGMLVASVGSTLAFDLGLSKSFAADEKQRLTFGTLEPLVSLLQETPLDKLMGVLIGQVNSGVDLKTLVTAGGLANARAFGGEDYIGHHTFNALIPSLEMARRLPSDQQPLPVFKVLYRNSTELQARELHHADTLHAVSPSAAADAKQEGLLRETIRACDWSAAEADMTALAAQSPDDAFQQLLYEIHDETDVHRTVLAWRSWAMHDLAGDQYADALLRQSVRYCLKVEQSQRDRNYPRSAIRELLPKLLDQYKLLGKSLGNREADDSWVEHLAETIYGGDRVQATETVAAAIAEGFAPEAIGEAISHASNLMTIRDPGRRKEWSNAQKPEGSTHGDSVGVHASDSANAWRHIVRVSNHRNAVASLIVGAFHTAGQSERMIPTRFTYDDQLETVQSTDANELLGLTEEAIKGNDQAMACAVAQRYTEQGHDVQPFFDLMLKYAISEDGALHAEKYFQTVTEEYATTRPTLRGKQLVALARVTASEHGYPAPGIAEAREMLKLA
ncbi:MAG: hypothetical protein O2955_02610 [Planctomycetota bacterium]|nr:hypothetical protein [Planctomycetota bacterium]MDA1211377.1 hypothetical protein [Planctomycetota bacterium]